MSFRTAYHILIDRFSGCDRLSVQRAEFAGGTLKGIAQKLDYLDWLGIDALWLSPFCRTSGYHGYYTTDFFRVEPRFGTLEDLVTLIDQAHRRRMKVIADFVPNHCSYLHSFFIEAQADRTSRFRKWFNFENWPDRYLTFLTSKELPKLNLNCPEAREHVIDSALYWLSWGLDGLRLDHAVGPDLGFWKEFKQRIKSRHPSCLLVGEVWLDKVRRCYAKTLGIEKRTRRMLLGLDTEELYRDYVPVFDGVLDFWLQERLPKISIAKILEHYSRFPADFLLPAFLDNHDLDRFLFRVANDEEKLKEAAEKVFCLPQPVILYYGTENGMTQSASIHSQIFGDNLARQPIDWNSSRSDLREFFRGLILKRRRN